MMAVADSNARVFTLIGYRTVRPTRKPVGPAQYSATLPIEFPKPRERSKEITLNLRGMTFAETKPAILL